jgi:hypothetical protein
MANFAEIVDGKVARIIVLSNPDLLDENGVEQEQLGIDLCNELIGPANWVQTSFNNRFRKQYGDIGFTYDADADVFIRPSPFPSWSLDSNYDWQPPTPMPDDGNDYYWDEDSLAWVAVPTEEPAP